MCAKSTALVVPDAALAAPDVPALKVSKLRMSDMLDDDRNANLGNARGLDALDNSIEEFGFIEPGVLDGLNKVMSGNKRKAVVQRKMGDDKEAFVIDIDGKTPIYFRIPQANLDSDDPMIRAWSRRMAYALNRVHELSLRWDPAQLERDESDGYNLSGLFLSEELAEIRLALHTTDAVDFDEYEPVQDADVRYRVVLDSLVREEAERIRATLPPHARIEQYRVTA